MISCQHPSSSFSHFVATDCTVLMMDERYPGYPVRIALTWCHLHLSLHSNRSLLLSLLDALCAWWRAGLSAELWQGLDAMASTKHEPITKVWGQSPSGGRAPIGSRGRAYYLVGSQWRSPPDNECLLYSAFPKLATNLSNYWYLAKSLNHTVNGRLIV